ncbi:STAS domain-containing protein [Planotetraspora sp. GP83]|uniref:STAS domain-containing protein n=1 Tax=Planotetraspora sp. GP83 TaxID=3156264 RepID=UPI0035194FC7
MPTRLDLTVSQETTHTVVALVGELDVISAETLSTALSKELEQGHSRLIIDASQLTFCDSMGLRLLLQFLGRSFEARGFLKLAGVHGTFDRILTVTGLRDAFPIFDTVAEALDA